MPPAASKKPVKKTKLPVKVIDIDAEKCDKCRFYLMETGDQGVCRRYPPTAAMAGMQGQVASFFPPMKYDGWCGEFKTVV